MAYSNPTYWSVDGVSLQTLAQNIETTTGLTPTSFRGEDITVPYRPGQIFVPKVPDSRTLEFKMWVKGSTATGGEPTTKSKRETFYDNWRSLRNLLWRPGEQFVLQKRFPLNNGVKVVEALAQFAGGFEPTMRGPHAAKFTLNLKLTDPFFYDTGFSSFALNPGDNSFNVDGDAVTRNVQVAMGGPVGGVWVRNQQLGVGVRYGSSIVGGNGFNVDCYNYEAKITPSNTRQNGAITHYGSPSWMLLKPGGQTINMSRDSGSGAVQLLWKAAWH